MAISELDRNTALVVIDLQKGIAALPAVHPIDAIVQRTNALIGVFRRHGLPIVIVTVDGSPPGRTEQPSNVAGLPEGWAELIDELDVGNGDYRVIKRTWGAFTGTGLEALLNRLDTTQVVIAGVATSLGVESIARHAREIGFNVTLATDAMTDRSPEAHENSILRIFPRLGETGTTQDIIDLLGRRPA